MSHDPARHEIPEADRVGDDRLASALSVAQFLVTGTVLLVVAALAYVAGMHSAKGGGHGGGEAGQGAVATTVDIATLLKPTPELISSGKSAFSVNCASCHGAAGRGDGVASAALNPKPRDFSGTYWRYGGGVARIVRTITEGSPGTAMAAFPSIPLADRFALAHFVRSLGSKPVEDSPEDLAWLGPIGGGGRTDSMGMAAGADVKPSVPVITIEKAMAALVEQEPPMGSAAVAVDPDAGMDLYAQRCARCHGGAGEGGVRVRMLGSAPYGYVVTRSLGAPKGSWATNQVEFDRLVLQGSTGYVMPSNGDLSRGELRALYLHTQKLRARQQTAGHAGS